MHRAGRLGRSCPPSPPPRAASSRPAPPRRPGCSPGEGPFPSPTSDTPAAHGCPPERRAAASLEQRPRAGGVLPEGCATGQDQSRHRCVCQSCPAIALLPRACVSRHGPARLVCPLLPTVRCLLRASPAKQDLGPAPIPWPAAITSARSHHLSPLLSPQPAAITSACCLRLSPFPSPQPALSSLTSFPGLSPFPSPQPAVITSAHCHCSACCHRLSLPSHP